MIQRLRAELKVNTTCGASNISFGLPHRQGINSAFLTMAMGAGMTSAITNPIEASIMSSITATDVLLGHDADCRRWIANHRASDGSAQVETLRRRGRRRAAAG